MSRDLQEQGCPFCGQRDARIETLGALDGVYRVNCPYCREFKITEEAYEQARSYSADNKAILAAYNCHHQLKDPKSLLSYFRSKPKENDSQTRVVDEVVETWWPAKQVWDRLDIVLLNIFYRAGKKPGHELSIEVKEYPFCFGEDGRAGFFILDRLCEAGFVDMNPKEGNPRRIKLTLTGFRKVDELQKGLTNKESQKVFIAMSFDPSLNGLFDNCIKPAVAACGYDAFRIDKAEHNEKICDKIEASIRQSRFVIADFTHNKHGVYYEAGLARGLGLQVVWTVKKSEIGNLHFDTRQYNHIDWVDEEDLKKRLEDRIKAMGL